MHMVCSQKFRATKFTTHTHSADWVAFTITAPIFYLRHWWKKCTLLTSVCTPGTHYQKAKWCLQPILVWATLLCKCMYPRGPSYHCGTSDTSVARAISIAIINGRCYMVQTNLHRVWWRCQPNRDLGIWIIPRSCSPCYGQGSGNTLIVVKGACVTPASREVAARVNFHLVQSPRHLVRPFTQTIHVGADTSSMSNNAGKSPMSGDARRNVYSNSGANGKLFCQCTWLPTFPGRVKENKKNQIKKNKNGKILRVPRKKKKSTCLFTKILASFTSIKLNTWILPVLPATGGNDAEWPKTKWYNIIKKWWCVGGGGVLFCSSQICLGHSGLGEGERGAVIASVKKQ